MRKHRLFARLRAGVLSLLTLGVLSAPALAQSLAGLTPAGSLVTIGFWEDEKAAGSLKDELMALDWDTAAETLGQLWEVMGAGDELPELLGGSGGDALEFCSAAQEILNSDAYTEGPYSGLFSVGFSPFNPLPAATVLLELTDTQESLVQDAISALIDCAQETGMVEVFELEQDGLAFGQIVIDYELNVAYSVNDGVLALSSSVDQLRQVLRLQAGSGEPSMADSRLYAGWRDLERGVSGFDWLVDYTVLADLAEMYSASFDAPELGSRLASAFRTAGGDVGSLSFQGSEIIYVNELLTDADGGDSELHDLLLSAGLSLPAPPILPEGGVLLGSQVLNVQGFFAYLQTWLDEIGRLVGEPLDLHELAAMFDVNLDALLLDWIGNDMHVVQVDPSFTLANLLRGPGQLVMVSTLDDAAAEAGFGELIELVQLATELDEDIDLGFDSRAASWRGVDYTRVRMGPFTDFGYVVLDGYLTAGMPLSVLHQAIDHHLDGTSPVLPAAFSTGNDLLSVQTYDVGTELTAAADMIRPFVQPLAFAMRNAALEELSVERWTSDWDSQDWSWDSTYGNADLSAVELLPLPLGQSTSGTVAGGFDSGGEAWFELQGISAGDSFSVRMESVSGDSMLELYVLETGEQKAYNDDYEWPSLDAQIDYTATEGRTYVARVSFYSLGASEHDFTIQTTLQPDADSEETVELEAPTFTALLDMFDLVPQAVDIVANRTGSLEGFQERRGDTVYTRYVLQADW